jgi:hypothetical protein
MDDDQFLLQVFASIDEAEGLSIFFPLLRRALVVDARHQGPIGPLLAVAPQVASTAERMAWVAAARPQFGRPEFIMMLPWLKSIRSLTDHGILTRLRELLVRNGLSVETAATMIRQAERELLRVERETYLAMIRGDGYDTLWEAPRDE